MNEQPELKSKPILRLQDLTFSFSQKTYDKVLNSLNLKLFPGQHIGIQGRNGSGKTTLFRCITGLLKPQSGNIFFHEKAMHKETDFQTLRKNVGFVLQNADDQLFFPSVKEDVAFGPLNLGLTPKEAAERTRQTLALLNIGDYEDRISAQLSGGERKLVAIASILAMRPEALLLDEPLNELDEAVATHMLQVLKEYPCAKLVVSHDRNFLEALCPVILEMRNGQLYN